MVSLSKGLGYPVGACLASAAPRRELAWEIRKRLGGGMRQSGILAAAALYALDCNLGRLPEDHENAKLLAERLSDCAAVRASEPESNIVMLDLLREGDTADSVIPRLAQAGGLVVPFRARRMRAPAPPDVRRHRVGPAARRDPRGLGGWT